MTDWLLFVFVIMLAIWVVFVWSKIFRPEKPDPPAESDADRAP
jgi:hypothetical protein